MTRSLPLGLWLGISAVIVVVDQITKAVVLSRFVEGEQWPVIPGLFDLTLWYNRGAAFSFLASHDGWQRWFFVVVAVVASAFITYLLVRHRHQALFATGLSLVLGGAIGNLIDRLRLGKVVDFFLFYQGSWSFPAFNVADSAITVGAVLLILDEIRRIRSSPKENPVDQQQ